MNGFVAVFLLVACCALPALKVIAEQNPISVTVYNGTGGPFSRLTKTYLKPEQQYFRVIVQDVLNTLVVERTGSWLTVRDDVEPVAVYADDDNSYLVLRDNAESVNGYLEVGVFYKLV